MKNTVGIVGLLLMLLGLSLPAESASNSTEHDKAEGSGGITVEDLKQGLKSAAHNVEKEIPKIGSAIGNAVKKLTDKEPAQSPQEPSKQKK
jgi:hypothetical protein